MEKKYNIIFIVFGILIALSWQLIFIHFFPLKSFNETLVSNFSFILIYILGFIICSIGLYDFKEKFKKKHNLFLILVGIIFLIFDFFISTIIGIPNNVPTFFISPFGFFMLFYGIFNYTKLNKINRFLLALILVIFVTPAIFLIYILVLASRYSPWF